MAVTLCDCNANPSNTGRPTCDTVFNTQKKVILVRKYKDDGTRNSITTSTTFNQAWLDGLINQADQSARWYPLPEMKNVTTERADSKKEEFEDGSAVFINQGKRSQTALLIKAATALLGKLEDWRCQEFGMYIIDASGSIIGLIENDSLTTLYPIDIDQSSWDPRFVFTTDSTIQKIQLNWDWHTDVQDKNLRMVSGADVSANILAANGLLDVNATVSNITVNGFRVTLTTDFGPANDPIKVKGLVTADFVSTDTATTSKLYNVTDTGDIDVTVAESSDGVYDVTFSVAQTSADVVDLGLSKNGYDFSGINGTDITIP